MTDPSSTPPEIRVIPPKILPLPPAPDDKYGDWSISVCHFIVELIFAVFSLYTHMLVSLTGCFTSGVIDRLGMGAVPYVVLLVVPVLGQMSD